MMRAMTASASPAGMMLRYRTDLRACDAVVRATGNGRGRIRIDRTLATSLLVQLGSDRRAEASDTLPTEIALLPAQSAGVFARRGWVGDILLNDGQRLGARTWLLERGKSDEPDRVAAIGYAAEAVAPVADYWSQDVQTAAGWLRPGVLQIVVSTSGVTVRTPSVGTGGAA